MNKWAFLFALMAGWCSAESADRGINDQLREMFSNISPPPQPAPFFYDIAAHEIDESWFVPVNTADTVSSHTWWTIYFEMRNAAVSQEILPETFSLREVARQKIYQDTIPVGILDLEYCKLKETAFDSGIYFIWSDSILYDAVTIEHPYALNSGSPERGTSFDVFSAAPLFGESDFRNVTFSIDPQFVFYGGTYNTHTQKPPQHQIMINFGDGKGWHTFNPELKSVYNILYPGEGLYKIEVKVVEDAEIKYAQSSFYVRSDYVSVEPDDIIDEIPGIHAGIYFGCDKLRTLDKVMIVVSGFDMYESNSTAMFYEQLVDQTQLIMLRNYGYDIIVVEWVDSKADLTENGDRLIDLIEYLKCKVVRVENNFTILGASMGALLANYALTKMETAAYIESARENPGVCYPGQMHNTRTFISQEGEYQGAFINIGAQQFTEILKNERLAHKIPSYTLASMTVDASFFRDKILDRKGVKQMLMFHIDSTDGAGRYYPHSERIKFKELMREMGDHPRFVKTVAMSSALINGKNQVALGNKIATSGDDYYRVMLTFHLRIPGNMKLPVEFISELSTHPGMERTNPVPVLKYLLRYPRKLNIKDCLKDIISLNTCSSCKCVLFYHNEKLLNMAPGIPWDILCGSRVSSASAVFSEDGERIRSSRGSSKLHAFGHLGFSFISDAFTGKATVKASYSIGGYVNFGKWKRIPVKVPLVDARIDVASELESFNFVPWVSAYDFRNPDSLTQDLANTDITRILERTPFDVMIGGVPHEDYPTTFPHPNKGQKHFDHREMRTDEADDDPDLTFLTREIGETYMFLDNLRLNRKVRFDAEKCIVAGSGANPRYRTMNRSGTNDYPGVWSRDKGLDIVMNGEAQMYAGESVRLLPGFRVSGGGTFQASIRSMQICKFSLKELRDMDQQKGIDKINDTTSSVDSEILTACEIAIYPNPFSSTLIVRTQIACSFKLTNAVGEALILGELQVGVNSIQCNSLTKGLYYLRLSYLDYESVQKVWKY